jgi:beta-lactamase regulating signal transducer with metallopeptidase domain
METFWAVVASNCVVVIILAGCLAVLGRFWRNPAALHLLWVFVLLKFVTPPVLTIPVRFHPAQTRLATRDHELERDDVPDVPAVSPGTRERAASGGIGEHELTVNTHAADGDGGPDAAPMPRAGQGLPMSWLVVAAWIWGVGSIIFACSQAYRILRFWRLLRVAEPAPSGVLAIAERVACRLGVRRLPRIVMLPLRMAPLVWSLGGRPRVVLPATLFERLDAAAREAILAHELAHVRRRDHWVRLLEMIVVTLFWWHPVAWRACWQLRTLEEECCDALVLGTASLDVRAYAITLLDTLEFLSERPVVSPLGATATAPALSLARRIKMLRSPCTVVRLTLGRLAVLLSLAAVPMALALAIEPGESKPPSRPPADALTAKVAAAPPRGIDLSYVPSAAQAFVAIRPAEMLKRTELPELKTLIQERCGPTLGKLRLPIEKIAQITWVPAGTRRGHEDGLGNMVIYQMTQPCDFQELLRAELPQAAKQEYQVQAGYIPEELTWVGSFTVIDGQDVWIDRYRRIVGTPELKAMVDAYRKATKRDSAKTEQRGKAETRTYYACTDATGRKRLAMLPDDRTIVFAEGTGALEEIFGPEQAIWKPYAVPGKDRHALLVWGARRGGPSFLDAKQWQAVREDHLVVWAERQPLESIEAWPGYPGFVKYGMGPFTPILNYPPTALAVRLGNPVQIRVTVHGAAGGWNAQDVASSIEAARNLAAVMGEMYRKNVEASPDPIRAHYVKLLDDYLDLLKRTKVAAEGEIVRTESIADPAVIRNAIQLLAAMRLREAQHGEPDAAKEGNSSEAATELTTAQMVLHGVNGEEVRIVIENGKVQLVARESYALSPKQVVLLQPKGRVTVKFRVASVGLLGMSDEMMNQLLQGTFAGEHGGDPPIRLESSAELPKGGKFAVLLCAHAMRQAAKDVQHLAAKEDQESLCPYRLIKPLRGHFTGKTIQATGELEHTKVPRRVREDGTVEGHVSDEYVLRVDSPDDFQVLP